MRILCENKFWNSRKETDFLILKKTIKISLSQVKISAFVIAFNLKIIGKNGYKVVE